MLLRRPRQYRREHPQQCLRKLRQYRRDPPQQCLRKLRQYRREHLPYRQDPGSDRRQPKEIVWTCGTRFFSEKSYVFSEKKRMRT